MMQNNTLNPLGYSVQELRTVFFSFFLLCMFSANSLHIASTVLLYWITSWSAIFLNKYVQLVSSCRFTCRYVYSHLVTTFSAPYFITLIQFISPTLALYLFSSLNARYKWSTSFPNIK